MFNFGLGEIALILLLALIFLGPERLPKVAMQLGKWMRDLRNLTFDFREEIENSISREHDARNKK